LADRIEAVIGIGANLPGPDGEGPLATCRRAAAALEGAVGRVVALSPWYRSAPVPASDQPWFVNGVAVVETGLGAEQVLAALHGIERSLGRRRRVRWEARAIDLDLLAFGDQVIAVPEGLQVPHPRLAERAFVLYPLADVRPRWRHPVTGRTVGELLAALPEGQVACQIAGGGDGAPAG